MLIALGDHQPELRASDVWIADNATLIGRVILCGSVQRLVWCGAACGQ